MFFISFTPLSPFKPPPSSYNPAFGCAAAASPLSYPSTSSWFPPGCELSSISLCSKFICTCSSSRIDCVHSPYVNTVAQLCLAGKALVGGMVCGLPVTGRMLQVQGGLWDALWDPVWKLEAQEEGNQGSASITNICWPFVSHSNPAYPNLLSVQPQPHAVSHSWTCQHP